ncbi:mavicyanin isoform X2 [Ricinus communis]|nr:mavicyanin isoform X2 [Ricinus communis]XP_048235555.1 mavicyanin isoform X2 [Ricinus communis]
MFVTSFQFEVGSRRGWIKPTGNETETYDDWATRNRFHVGDSLYFRYQSDSVLVVNSTAFRNCITSNPISEFDDGNTVFEFDRHGFFYFVSGQPGHCKAGQKMVVRVMAHQVAAAEAPNAAPSPKENGNGEDDWNSFNWGPPSLNSTVNVSVASYFLTALGGVLAILYLLM